MKTTLNKIREHLPCSSGWSNLLNHLGKNKADYVPLEIINILNSNGLDEDMWCMRADYGHEKKIKLFAFCCARQMPFANHYPRA